MALKSDDSEVQGRFVSEQATPPTAAAGAGGGTSPPAPVVAANAADEHGRLTFGSGTTSLGSGAAQVRVTLNRGLGSNSECVAVVTPANDATEVLGLSVVNNYTSGELTSFDICAHTAPTDAQANTVYAVDWICQ